MARWCISVILVPCSELSPVVEGQEIEADGLMGNGYNENSKCYETYYAYQF